VPSGHLMHWRAAAAAAFGALHPPAQGGRGGTRCGGGVFVFRLQLPQVQPVNLVLVVLASCTGLAAVGGA
jgi:hypothetical protein